MAENITMKQYDDFLLKSVDIVKGGSYDEEFNKFLKENNLKKEDVYIAKDYIDENPEPDEDIAYKAEIDTAVRGGKKAVFLVIEFAN